MLVSAAAVTVDQGKSFEAMDETLAAATRRPSQGRRGRDEANAEPVAPLSKEEQARAAAAAAAVEGLWQEAEARRNTR